MFTATLLASSLFFASCSRKVDSETLGLDLATSQPIVQNCARSQICSPLTVRLSAMDSSGAVPEFPVIFGFCNGVSAVGFQMISASSQTDTDGVARLTVRASAHRGDTECFSARLKGRSREVRFKITVTDPPVSKRIAVDLTQGTPNTSNGVDLTAKTAFGFRFSIVDEKGDVITAVNETMDLLFSYVSTSVSSGASFLGLSNSWMGQSAVTPTQISCTFVAGLCTSPLLNYQLTDSRRKVIVTVTPVSAIGSYGPGSLTVNTTPGSASRLVFSDAVGGPMATPPAAPILSTQVANADDVTPHDYVLSYSDSAGNFLRDIGAADTAGLSPTADGTVMVLGSNLNAQAPAGGMPLFYRFAPGKSGAGTLSVTQTGVTTAASLAVNVSYGALARFRLDTSAIPRSGSNLRVSAGASTPLSLRAEDQKGNLCANFNCNSGQCALSVQALNGTSVPAVSGGANSARVGGGGTTAIDMPTSSDYQTIGGISFTSGLSDSPVILRFNDASRNPQVKVQGFYLGAPLAPVPTGTFQVDLGAFDHLNLYSGSNLPCMQPFGNCVANPAVRTVTTYTLKPEDAGGNILSSSLPLAAGSVSSFTSTYAEWAYGGGGFPSVAFNPRKSGNSSLTIVYAGVSTTFGIQNTRAGAPASFSTRSNVATGACSSGTCYRASEGYDCIPILVSFLDQDANSTRVISGTLTLSGISATPDVAGGNTGGVFYQDAACSAGNELIASSISFTSATPNTNFYFKANVRSDGLSPTYYTVTTDGLSQTATAMDYKIRVSN